MEFHSIYLKATGEIIGYLFCPFSELTLVVSGMHPSEDAIEGIKVDGTKYYFDLINTIRPRPIIEAEPNKLSLLPDNDDSVVIPGLPVPCTVKVDDQEYPMTDPRDKTFEFTTGMAGTYTVSVEAFPYITKTWEVVAE